jgi:hypothetical protein
LVWQRPPFSEGGLYFCFSKVKMPPDHQAKEDVEKAIDDELSLVIITIAGQIRTRSHRKV